MSATASCSMLPLTFVPPDRLYNCPVSTCAFFSPSSGDCNVCVSFVAQHDGGESLIELVTGLLSRWRYFRLPGQMSSLSSPPLLLCLTLMVLGFTFFHYAGAWHWPSISTCISLVMRAVNTSSDTTTLDCLRRKLGDDGPGGKSGSASAPSAPSSPSSPLRRFCSSFIFSTILSTILASPTTALLPQSNFYMSLFEVWFLIF